jgi:hypothetical protein
MTGRGACGTDSLRRSRMSLSGIGTALSPLQDSGLTCGFTLTRDTGP